jgi:hypothetical protein
MFFAPLRFGNRISCAARNLLAFWMRKRLGCIRRTHRWRFAVTKRGQSQYRPLPANQVCIDAITREYQA